MNYDWYWLDARRKQELELDPRAHWAEVRVEEWYMRIQVSEHLLDDTTTHTFIVEEMQHMFAATHERLRMGMSA